MIQKIILAFLLVTTQLSFCSEGPKTLQQLQEQNSELATKFNQLLEEKDPDTLHDLTALLNPNRSLKPESFENYRDTLEKIAPEVAKALKECYCKAHGETGHKCPNAKYFTDLNSALKLVIKELQDIVR